MTNETKESLREEWKNFVEGSSTRGADMHIDSIANFWLEKLDQALKSQREEIVGQKEKYIPGDLSQVNKEVSFEDSAKKQECEFGGKGDFCNEKCKVSEPIPKVATSEKECNCGKDDLYGVFAHPHADWCLSRQESVTPHESEDWNEFENTFDDHGTGVIETSPEALKSFIRKVYQRGREEGEHKLNIMKAACEGACDQDKMKLLSLAVQEIGKEKKEEPKKCICDRYTHCAWHTLHGGINQGLDKAIEIISGLKSKK